MGGERLPNRLPEAKESRRVAAVSAPSPFGQNEWLVEEMYRKFREHPSSVDPSWHEFLVDYSPEPTTEAQTTTTTTTGNGQPAQAPAPAAPPEPAPAPAPAEGDEVQILRGAAAAVVKNMSSSLEVPTATSVRAIPAKLMIDNRIVINNHLKRTRGGK